MPAEPHGEGVHGLEVGLDGPWCELVPAVVGGVAELAEDGYAGEVRLEARSLLGLDLEQLEQAHGVARRSQDPELAVGAGDHEPGGVDVEELDAPVGQHGEQVDHVEVVDEGVGDLHEGLDEDGFSGHVRFPG